MKFYHRLITPIFILVAVSLSAQENYTFDDWDEDNDQLIEHNEFVDVFTTAYVDDWNSRDDDHLDDEDFMNATFRIFDTDDDGHLSFEEWLFGRNYYFDDYIIIDDVSLYDLNKDQYISYEEYTDALYATDYYADLDVDKDDYLNQFELTNAVFNNWDVDDSFTLSRGEYRSFDNFYLDI